MDRATAVASHGWIRLIGDGDEQCGDKVVMVVAWFAWPFCGAPGFGSFPTLFGYL
jgi:hypothetical protein